MVVVSKENNYAVVIIRFDVEPETHQQLVNAAIDNTERIMKIKPGFVSASFHKSIDDRYVLNYAQWKSREIYQDSITHMTSEEENILEKNRATIDKLAKDIDLNIYELESTSSKNNITISKNNNLATFINFFFVKGKNQQKLIDLWKQFAKDVVEKQPGFISANLHKSFDGSRAVNYAQWQAKEDQERLIESDEAKAWRDDFGRLADVSPYFYDVIYTSN
jgi:quinol monooxygenase YgiN